MSNATVIGFGPNGALRRMRNRLGTDLTSDEPITSGELALIRATLQATASVVEIGEINPLDYDAAGDGTTDDTEALEDTISNAETGSSKQLLFTPGTYKTNSITVPAGVSLRLVPGSKLKVPTGQTVTMEGGLNAGPYQIFEGPGTVEIGRNVRPKPEWWGVTPIAVFESGTELQPGINTIETQWEPAEGSIAWGATPIVRATLYDAANVESNLLYWWVESDENGVFTLKINMLVGVTLTGDLKFFFEVIGFEPA